MKDDEFPNNIIIGIHYATGAPYIVGYGDTDDEVLTNLVDEQINEPRNEYKVYSKKVFTKRRDNWKNL